MVNGPDRTLSLAAMVRGIEPALRRAWLAALVRATVGRARTTIPRGTPLRVLYLRHDRVGDMIMATGLLRALATRLPHVTLDVLASPGNAVILRDSPHVREVLIHRRRGRGRSELRRRLRAGRYEVVIDGLVPWRSFVPGETVLLMLATRARHRVGIAGRANDAVFSVPLAALAAGAHYTDQFASIVAAFGMEAAGIDWRPELYLRDADRREAAERWQTVRGDGGRLLVNVSASDRFRYWSVERYAATLRAVRAEHPGLRIGITGGPADETLMREIADAGNADPLPIPGLAATLAAVESADWVLTPDTSIAHAAAAFARPVTVMHLRDGAWFTPYRVPGRSLIASTPTLEGLDVATVREAVLAMLAGRANDGSRRR